MRTWVWIFRTHLLPRADWPDDLAYLESSRSRRILSQRQVPWGMTHKFDLWSPHVHEHTCSHRNTHIHVRVHWKQNWGELIKVLRDKMTTTKATVHDSVLKIHCSKKTRESSSSLVFFLPWDQRHTPLIPTFCSLPDPGSFSKPTWTYSHWVCKPLTISRKFSHSTGQVKLVAIAYNRNCS